MHVIFRVGTPPRYSFDECPALDLLKCIYLFFLLWVFIIRFLQDIYISRVNQSETVFIWLI